MPLQPSQHRADVSVPAYAAASVRAFYDAHIDYLDELIARTAAEESRAVADEQAAAARVGRVRRRLESLRDDRRKAFDDYTRAFPDPDL